MNHYLLVNGELTSSISARDRGLQYGDGLFETIAVFGGKACQLQRHFHRLTEGLEKLGIEPVDLNQLQQDVELTATAVREGVIKVCVTRGESSRGYAIPTDIKPTTIISAGSMPLQKAPVIIDLMHCKTPVSINPLTAGLKHLNRLDQVMARREVDLLNMDEGLMSNTQDGVIEATSANVFLLQGDQLITPDLKQSGIAGVLRDCVMRVAKQISMRCETGKISLEDCLNADGILLCNSLQPVRLAARLQDTSYDSSIWPDSLIEAIYREAYSHG